MYIAKNMETLFLQVPYIFIPFEILALRDPLHNYEAFSFDIIFLAYLSRIYIRKYGIETS